MKKGLRKFKPSNHIDTEAEVIAFLQAALSHDEIDYFLSAVDDVSETKGMTALARKLNMTKKAFLNALLNDDGPSLSVLLKLIRFLGFYIKFDPVKTEKKNVHKEIPPEINIAAAAYSK